MQNSLNKAREIYFKYFPSQRMARMKATVRRKAMMGVLLAHSVVHTKCSEKTQRFRPTEGYQSAKGDQKVPKVYQITNS